MENIKLICGDCLDAMKDIPDKSVDMILCDLPYGVLNKNNPNAKWDCVIPFDELWQHYERIIKDNGAIVLFAQGMFTAKLMTSNESLWRYNLVWDKYLSTGFLNANRMPLRCHEDICVFYKSLPTYNPQFTKGKPLHSRGNSYLLKNNTNNNYGKIKEIADNRKGSMTKYPTSIIRSKKDHPSKATHPTAKPISLLTQLIKTYTNEGEVVLDNTMGSGSTGVAAVLTDRKFIGIELDQNYFQIANKRISDAVNERKSSLFNPNL